MIVEIEGLTFSYGNDTVLNDVSFTIQGAELLAVLGPNGVGKSTMFNCIMGLSKRYAGKVLLDGESTRSMDASTLARKLAYVPQSHNPSFNYSVLDMVLMGTTSQVNSISSPGSEQIRLSEAALEKLGISYLKNRDYTKISGGERQLTLIARAIAQQSRLIIMDEPTANLDYGNQLRVLTQVRELVGEGYTVIFSTHNPDHSFLFADKVLALHKGKVIAYGTPADTITPELIKTLYAVDVILQYSENNICTCVPVVNQTYPKT